MGVTRCHTRDLVARATMLLLLPTAAAWNLMSVGTRRTATLVQVAPSRAGAPAMTVGDESAPVLKLVQKRTQPLGEDEAKRAWLAKQDGPSFEGGPPWTGGAAAAAPHVTPPAAAAAGTASGAALSDAQIKEVTVGTLNKLLEILNQMAAAPDMTTSSMTSEDTAKTAWLAKQEPQVSNAPRTREAMLLPCPNHHALVVSRYGFRLNRALSRGSNSSPVARWLPCRHQPMGFVSETIRLDTRDAKPITSRREGCRLPRRRPLQSCSASSTRHAPLRRQILGRSAPRTRSRRYWRRSTAS